MKRYYVIVEGRVQGVGFRYFCMRNAKELGLTGTVRNMDNGMVEIYIQGDEYRIQQFLEIIKKGDYWIRVDEITLKEVSLIKNEKTFSTIY
ncbi:MAG: acylphosphatase [Solobacterium sp.]|nr:acylphosphatase [Solobacterium sp.]